MSEGAANGAQAAEYVESMDIERIMRMIPHRYPFLMIDKVREIKPAEGAIGIKNVSANESFFAGHFPAKPIMPGVLLVEAMAQTAAVLVVHTLNMIDQGKLVYFMTVDNARFRRPVVPGDVVELHVDVVRNRANVWKFTGVAKVDGQAAAQADFSAMIVDPPAPPSAE
ncbi:MAG: 3-hydroxyacyl-ACP dehydratase FabZ [Neomegalonema sp.]|nr:3-hydroxyacyl-ACP dehydratase FabZ [Neomegalonema sp.]